MVFDLSFVFNLNNFGSRYLEILSCIPGLTQRGTKEKLSVYPTNPKKSEK